MILFFVKKIKSIKLSQKILRIGILIRLHPIIGDFHFSKLRIDLLILIAIILTVCIFLFYHY